jgi:glycosyltransferase involved in cell wall biosynthesis
MAPQIHAGPLTLIVAPETLFALRCYQILRRQRFDVVHCLHYSDALGVAASQLFQRTPYVVHVTFLPVARRRRPLENVFLRTVVRRANAVVAVSRPAAELTNRFFNRLPTTVPVPCDIGRFRMRDTRDLDRPVIFAAGAFAEPRKGAHLLVRAFAGLKQRVPHARLRCSGLVPAPLRRALLASVDRHVREHIEFLGVGSPDDLPDLYGEAAVTVLPSVREGLGMTLIESLACGTPVVGGDDGGARDVVTDGIGTLFTPAGTSQPQNVEGLTVAIEQTLDLYRSTPDLHRRCRRHAEQFGWDVVGPQMLECYRAAIATSGPVH